MSDIRALAGFLHDLSFWRKKFCSSVSTFRSPDSQTEVESHDSVGQTWNKSVGQFQSYSLQQDLVPIGFSYRAILRWAQFQPFSPFTANWFHIRFWFRLFRTLRKEEGFKTERFFYLHSEKKKVSLPLSSYKFQNEDPCLHICNCSCEN